MAKLLTGRVWILIIFLVLALLAINPSPGASGIQITSVDKEVAKDTGLSSGEILVSINDVEITSVSDFDQAMKQYAVIEAQNVSVLTDKGLFEYEITNDIGFDVSEELQIENVRILDSGLEDEMVLEKINSQVINDSSEFYTFVDELVPKNKFVIKTDKNEYAFLYAGRPNIKVSEARTSNLRLGLDLEGGTRALVKPVSNETVSDQDINNLIAVMNKRFDAYGISDMKIRAASDLSGEKFVVIEIAGSTREEVRELVSQQGKFEAKIGNEVAFTGGKEDIRFVCKDDGSCSGVRPTCSQLAADRWACRFEFRITLSDKAAANQARITGDLEVNLSEGGEEYLSEKLDLYLDGKKVDSLMIGADLKGQPVTDIMISGPGYGPTQLEGMEDAAARMSELQTILITGSFPFDLEVVKLDTISPRLGDDFIRNIMWVALAAIIAVACVIGIRYRKWKIIIPMIVTSLLEVFLILGFAGMIKWNLDLAAIAGIIAAVGTGVDDLIVVTDEVLKGGEFTYNWKEKLKRAFFIVFTAYATTVAAMIPLWWAGAGMIRGFAMTTIVGITIGVFLTRPAFASIIEKLIKN